MSYKLPVTIEFDEEQIGSLTIFDDNFKIPFNSVFTLQVKVSSFDSKKPGYEIIGVSLIPDSNYSKYLKHSKKYDTKLIKSIERKKKKSNIQ